MSSATPMENTAADCSVRGTAHAAGSLQALIRKSFPLNPEASSRGAVADTSYILNGDMGTSKEMLELAALPRETTLNLEASDVVDNTSVSEVLTPAEKAPVE